MRKIYLLLLTVLLAVVTNAQISIAVTGNTNTTPNLSTSYASLSLALTDLNNVTAMTGPVTLTLFAGTSETAPATGLTIGSATLNAVLSATNTVTIVKAAGGATTLNAGIGTATPASAAPDGILKLTGADFITIDGLTFTDGNATNPATMEFGLGLFKLSVTDGCNNNTIRNCTFNMQRINNATGTAPMVDGAVGILVINSTAVAATTNLTITAASGTNSNNKFYTNTVNSGNTGIALIGFAAATPFTNADQGNDVGGSSVATANQVLNFGGGGTTSAATAIRTLAQYGINISYNTINSNNGVGVNHGAALNGILNSTAVSANATITNNTITLKGGGTTSALVAISNAAGSTAAGNTISINNNTITGCTYATATSGAFTGITNTASPATLNINNNQLTSSATNATSGTTNCFQNTGAPTVALSMSSNTVNGWTFNAATSGTFVGVTTSAPAAAATLAINGNNIQNITHAVAGTNAHNYIVYNDASSATVNVNNNTFTNLNVNTTGSVTFITRGTSSMTATGSESCSNNQIVTGFTKGGAGGTVTCWTNGGGGSSVNGSTMLQNLNNFSNITLTGATAFSGILNSEGASSSNGPTKTMTNNTFNNITTGAGAFNGLTANFSGAGSTYSNNTISNVANQAAFTGISIGSSSGQGTHTCANNTISNIVSSGTGGQVICIIAGSTTIPTLNVNNNIISGVSSTSTTNVMAGIGIIAGAITNVNNNTISGLTLDGTGANLLDGILVQTGTTTTNVFKNKIYNITRTAAAGATSVCNGMRFSGGTTVNAYNNIIGDLKAPATNQTDAIHGITVSSTSATSNYNLYYNTIYLNASSSGANFGTSGIFHAASATATTAALDLRNNIIVNNSNPAGTGLTVAYRRSGTALNNYSTTSDRNLFFAGGPCTNRMIYDDGTNSLQTLAAYKALATLAPRDANSITEDPKFVSITGSSATFLHINPAIATQIESAGTTIAGFTDDFDGDVRTGTPDIGADEFAGTVAVTCTGTPSAGVASPSLTTLCANQAATICLSGQTSAAGISIQWQSSATSGGPYTNISCAGGNCYTTSPLAAGTYYYVAVVTCAGSGLSSTSNEVTVSVAATPTVTVNPPAPSICTGGTGILLTASGAVTYTWSPSTGLSSTTGTSVTANPAVTTTYTVTGTNAAGCTSTATVTVTVNNSPTIVSVGASSSSICLGSSVNLTSSANSNLSPVSLLSEGFEGGAIPAGWVSINGGTGNLWVVPQVNGTARTGTRAAEYNFNTVQAANAYLITSGMNLTAGVTYTISSWFRSSGATFPEKLKVTVGTAQTVAAQTTILQDVGTVTNTVYAQQSATFTPAVSGTYYFGWNCYSAADEFFLDVDDISITAPSALPTYSWTSTPAGFTSSLQNPTGVSPTVTTTYNLTVTNVPSGCSASGNVTVTVGTPIVSSVVVQPTTCVTTNGSITLTVSGGTGGVGPYTFAWTGPGVNPTSQNQSNLGVGAYTVTVTDVPSGCSNIITYPLPGPGGCDVCPTVPTLATNPALAACQNTNVTLTASGLTSMGITYGITFKYSASALADPYTGGTLIATVNNAGLTGGGTQAVTTTTFPTAGNYIVYAILSPSPIDPGCRPFAQVNLTVNSVPAITCPANITTTTTVGLCGAAVTYPAATATGSPAPVVTYSIPSGSVFPKGTTTVTATATNTCGVATCTFTVTVNDNQPPAITCPANITRSTDPGLCSAVVTFAAPTATDNCPGVTVTSSPASGSVFPKGTTTVTSTATDAAGNTATCTFTITVNDTQAPVITCPANIVKSTDANQCGAVVTFPFPTVTDNCPFGTIAPTPVSITQSTSTAITPANSAICGVFPVHNDNSIWRAYDLTPFALAGPFTVNTVTFGIQSADAGGAATSQPVTVRLYTSAGAFPGGVRTQVASQTFTIPDQAGTLFTATLTTPPTVSPTAILVLELFTPDGTAAGNSFIIGSNTAAQTGPSFISAAACTIPTPTDIATIGFPNMHVVLNAAGTVPVPVPGSGIVSVPASGSFFPKGTTTVTSTATDNAGNTAVCTFTVTVNDTQAPTITCPANIATSTTVGSCTATVNYTAVTATDNCPGTVITRTAGLASGAAFPIGVTTVTHLATDAAGNTSTCSFTVTVTDVQLPVIGTQPVNRTVCAGIVPTFSVTATNTTSYQWQLWNGTTWNNIAGATSATLTLPAATSAMNDNSYRVIVTGLCSSVTSGFATLFVNPLPTVQLTASSSPVLLPTQTTGLVATVNPTGGTIAWFKNGAPYTGSTTNLGVGDVGTYRFVYTDLNGCVNTSGDVVVSAQVSDKFYVFPNPNVGAFSIRFYNSSNQPVTVTVYNSVGEKVFSKSVVTTALAYSKIDVDLGAGVSGGIYLVELHGSDGKLIGAKSIIVGHR